MRRGTHPVFIHVAADQLDPDQSVRHLADLAFLDAIGADLVLDAETSIG